MRLAPSPESFQVEEIPAYDAVGTGEHLYVEIEKRDLTTDVVTRLLARTFGVSHGSIGFAGRKDRHAVTRQWFSIHSGEEEYLARVPTEYEGGSLRVLRASRHRNKLRLGHLRGNRFVLTLEGAGPLDETAARLATLAEQGLPNRFGTQRFGVEGRTLATARAWGEGQRPEGDRRFQKLVASAAQSAIFNAVLEARQAAGLLYTLREGDVAARAGGRPFLCSADELEDLNRRAAPGTLELAATGPLPGTWKLGPSPEIEAQERASSEATGVRWEWFARGGPLESPGDRRVLVLPFLESPHLEAIPGGARLVFALPRGAYATEVLRELDVEVMR